MTSPDPLSFSAVFSFLKDIWFLFVLPVFGWVWRVEKHISAQKAKEAEVLINREHFTEKLDNMESRMREDVKEIRNDIKVLLAKKD